MADKIVLVDTSILIDYFRKSEKSNSALVKLFKQGYTFCISAVTEYEIYSGATLSQSGFWEEILKKTKVLAFDQLVVKVAVETNNNLKRKRKQIAIADLFIASTAIAHDLPIATLNRKHFDRIDGLQIVE
ncbi:MAG TPA: PIN domain-containing protein [Mucilaginibacter sp.]|jgi:predicted nucleic acid-binding protein|nr:PIN domain-containing protein [Mucilaginibacter sp.]